jgi:hypothetical protein
MAQPRASPRHEPTLKAERILMMDFTSTQAQAKEVEPSTSHEGCQTKAAAAKPPNTSSPLTADRVDKMYRQPAEIHAITITQLLECAR